MKLQIEYLNVDELKEYTFNARKHNKKDVQAIASSIREFGFKDPIGIWGKENIIVEGHGRFEACKLLGIKEVPVIRLDDLTDEQRKAYALAHNKTAELSSWNIELLTEELKSITDINMSEFGFKIKENVEIDEDEYIIKNKKDVVSKRGDIYKLGNHILMCGDSTNKDDIKKLMGGKQADLIVTDPPYNVSLGTEKGRAVRPSEAKALHRRTDGLAIENDYWENDDQFINFLVSAFTNMIDCVKEGGAFYIWYASTQSYNFLKAVDKVGLTIRQQLIWVKSNFALGRQDYQWQHEPCLYGWKAGAGHYFVDDRTLSTILEEKKPTASLLHPTMKPIELLARLITNSSKRDELVLDIFGGSGSTLIACEKLGRTCYMMEIDPYYVDVIIDRWETLTNQKAIKI